MSLNLKKLRISALSGFLFTAGLVFSAPMPRADAFSASDITPIYLSPGDETAINVNTPTGPTSFGYFFDITVGTKALNALGLAAQTPFSNGTGTYDVTLWKYANGGLNNADYTQLATVNFDSTCVNTTCTTKDNFYWLEVPLLYLYETASDPNQGYAVSAIGDFSSTNGASIFVDGLGTFNSAANYDGGGYNFFGGSGYPIPVGDPLDITTGNGFYNSNISLFQVPGPLPVMGAAAAFGWSRRLRRRINTSA
ncbi:MAG: hypothetical protein WCI65_09305 [Synechococcaceae cyanobacterium ELA263]